MFNLESIIRPNIRELEPYSSARGLYAGMDAIFLDANENPFGELNRYPDPYQWELKSLLAEITGQPPSKIFTGNGSDEVIDLMFRIFCSPGKDCALTVSPTYGMYAFSAGVNNVKLINIPLNQDFTLDREKITGTIYSERPRLLIFCSPNNPTGNLFDRATMEEIIDGFEGVVLIDEAYIDFCNEPSWAGSLEKFPNLVIARTLSKAYGLAAARIGFAIASEEIISVMTKVKPPYNISGPNLRAAAETLRNRALAHNRIELILEEKKRVESQLQAIECVSRVFPSDTNFLLVEFSDAATVFSHLLEKRIVTRDRSSQVRNCLRITIGTAEENDRLLDELKNLQL